MADARDLIPLKVDSWSLIKIDMQTQNEYLHLRVTTLHDC